MEAPVRRTRRVPRWTRWTGLFAAVLVVGSGAVGTQPVSASTPSVAAGTTAATSGCGKDPALAGGTRSIQSGGKSRSFILRIPDSSDRNRPYRLIFGFHWNGGTANDVDSGGTTGYPWSYYGLRSLADDSAIFVAPQGLNNGWANSGGEDLTFVDNMVNLIEGALCVDTIQLFSLGFSYGGGMSYAIACARATVFRAVAVYSGGQLSGCGGGTQPIAYIGLHGLRDPVLNISAGRSLRDRFVGTNGCTPQSPREPAPGSLTHVVTYYSGYSGCRAGYPVAWAGLTEDLTVTNTGTTAINGWSLVFTLPGGQRITSGWNASYAPASGRVTAGNAAYNAVIAPNASVSVGFQATHTGDTAVPAAFVLNGAACAVA
jgi:poly(3-hydroxybutyrate) depolymerase